MRQFISLAFRILTVTSILGLAFWASSWAQSKAATPRSTSTVGFDTLAAKAAQARDADQLKQAESLYRQALVIRPKWAEGWWSLGTILYDQDRYREAAHAFRQLLAADPKHGTGHAMLALCLYELGDNVGALNQIQDAKEFGIQNNEQLHRVLMYHEAMLLLRIGRYESASEVLHLMTRQGVSGEEVDLAYGMTALLMRPSYLPVKDSSTYKVVLKIGRAEALNSAKKFDEARQLYSDALAQCPDCPNIHYAFGHFLLAIKRTDEAIPMFEEEIRRNPNHTRARLQIAAAYYRIDSPKGLPYAESAVKLEPKFSLGHYLLGLLYLDTGNVTKAIEELEVAQKMIPEDSQVYYALGNAYSRAGRREDAARARATFARLSADVKQKTIPSTYGEQSPTLDPNKLDSSASQPNP